MNHSTELTPPKESTQWVDAGALRLKAPLAELLKYWEKERLITPLDRHFALEMARLHPNDAQEPLFMLLCALLSQQLSAQHTCLVLEHIVPTNPMAEPVNHCQIRLSLPELIARLQNFEAVGEPHSNKPLIFDGGRLYLERYHHFETEVASALTRLSLSQPVNSTDKDSDAPLRRQLDYLFPNATSSNATPALEPHIDWQKVATATALGKKLAVITGGPGTGKTTTVTKLLLLQQLGSPKQIRLVAPTGKAAARLSESIKASKARLEQELRQAQATNEQGQSHETQALLAALKQVPEEASTLHRLLGVIPNSAQFRHHQGNPLRLDLLIVDE
ncbi:MAG: AAA family ATPase, partial [Shewanella sp.]